MVAVTHKGTLKPPEDCLGIVEVSIDRSATDVMVNVSPTTDEYHFLSGKIGPGEGSMAILTVTAKGFNEQLHNIKTSVSDNTTKGQIEGSPVSFSTKSTSEGKVVTIVVKPGVFKSNKDKENVNAQFWAPHVTALVRVYDKRQTSGSDTDDYEPPPSWGEGPSRTMSYAREWEFKQFMQVAEKVMERAENIAKVMGVKK